MKNLKETLELVASDITGVMAFIKARKKVELLIKLTLSYIAEGPEIPSMPDDSILLAIKTCAALADCVHLAENEGLINIAELFRQNLCMLLPVVTAQL